MITNRNILYIIFCYLLVSPSHTIYALDKSSSKNQLQISKPAQVEDTDNSIPPELSNPRATMRTLLVAIQDVAQNSPEKIHLAIATLEPGYLTEANEEALQKRASLLAKRLAHIIETLGVHLEDIPEKGVKHTWYFYKSDKFDKSGKKPVIALKRISAGSWHFTGSTIASIPALEAEIKQLQSSETADIKSINADRRSARATMATFQEAFNKEPPDLVAAALTLNGLDQNPTTWENIAERRAIELKNIIDKTQFVILSSIPNQNDAPEYTWYAGEQGNIVLARVEEGEFKGEWRFSPSTVANIKNFYLALEDQPLIQELRERGIKETMTLGMQLERMMPNWLRLNHFGLDGWQWLAFSLLVLLGLFIRYLFPFILLKITKTLLTQKFEVNLKVQRGAFDSFGLMAMFIVWLGIIHHLQLPAELLGVLAPFIKFLITLSFAFSSYRMVDVIGEQLIKNTSVQLTSHDELLIPLVRKVLRLLVVIVVIMFVMEFWFHQPPSTIIGALGVGGIAIALAAKNTLSNFFGSLTVLADRPFSVGDWIVIGDVEGTVEYVGFRSTSIRTFYNSVISIPNSRMVDSHVDNYGVRTYRRIKTMLSLTYETPPDKIDAFCEGVRELIRLHPYTRKDYYHVYLNQFNASSLDILLYCFLNTPDWSTELRERHTLFLDIIRLSKKLGVDFAYPTQTLHMVQPDSEHSDHIPSKTVSDSEQEGIEQAAEVFQSIYGEQQARKPVKIPQVPLSKKL